MLNVKPLEEIDHELIRQAERVIEANYRYGRHHIGAAVLSASGTIHAAVHVEANVGRITVCGEAMVIGKSISEGDHEFKTIVAVAHPHPHEDIEKCWVVAPCGMCRELITDYGEHTEVIIPYQGEVVKCKAIDLLPEKYSSDL